MALERLNFSEQAVYYPSELAIHLGRYVIAKSVCKDLDVLDVACGEGYGAYIMATRWEANSVKGVDISSEAIDSAKDNFRAGNVEYFCHNAENISSLFESQRFDLIVSFETIEHVKSPAQFLSEIRKLLKPGGIIIISCPNDRWYYENEEEKNPFHERTFSFNEFKSLAEEHLGAANQYLLGLPLMGFGNFPVIEESGGKVTNQMLSSVSDIKPVKAYFIPEYKNHSQDESLYYIGIWGNTTALDFDEYALHLSLDQEYYLKELIKGKKWLETHHEEQLKQIEQLIEGKKWLETHYEEQLKQIEQLIEGKKWLETQSNNWELLAEERLKYIEQLIEGKDWLETQYNTWKQIAEEQQEQIKQLSK